jgi:hypothetical protein
VYEESLAGRGAGIREARPAIELVFAVNQADLTSPAAQQRHPLLAQTNATGPVLRRRAA